ncbi:hypothetical protein MTP10_22225 [Nonomuraea sp. 3-1Str]|uniref:hypothetical protein n=1 Tax=Nonomuraea sp. 3-1Str TaxID=2929801 RepID=UPI00285C9FD9|nr:hypothetical protein [Nonomuraea sp. 3-1Str]MDR8411439.1 hypothetical protein [Nonomuraea sp. 3-1Str]
MTRLADRLLEMVAPHTVARATDCGYQCCYANFWRYCCYYPNGTSHCDGCITNSSSQRSC